jgi:hypothetical protein
MRLRLISAFVLAAAILSLPAWAQQDPGKGHLDSDKLLPGSFLGKLISLPAAGNSFTLEITYSYLVPTNAPRPAGNPNAVNNLMRDQQQIAQLQKKLASAKKPQDAAQAMQQLQNVMAQMQRDLAAAQAAQNVPIQDLFKVVTDRKTVEFQAAADAVVRSLFLPLEYDDKGELKKFTKEEIRALRGDNPLLPGFEAKIEDLKVGLPVIVVMAPVVAKKDGDKESPKEGEKPAPDPTKKARNQVTLIVIAGQTSTTTSVSDKKGKK